MRPPGRTGTDGRGCARFLARPRVKKVFVRGLDRPRCPLVCEKNSPMRENGQANPAQTMRGPPGVKKIRFNIHPSYSGGSQTKEKSTPRAGPRT